MAVQVGCVQEKMSATSPRPSPLFTNGGEGENLLSERFAARH